MMLFYYLIIIVYLNVQKKIWTQIIYDPFFTVKLDENKCILKYMGHFIKGYKDEKKLIYYNVHKKNERCDS